jgi:hypothetical protein
MYTKHTLPSTSDITQGASMSPNIGEGNSFAIFVEGVYFFFRSLSFSKSHPIMPRANQKGNSEMKW